MTNILVCDDDKEIVDAIEIYQIGRASVGKECVRRCRSRWSPYH